MPFPTMPAITTNDDSLIYASASRGFKSGGFNTLGDITFPVDTFGPEYVWNSMHSKAWPFIQCLEIHIVSIDSSLASAPDAIVNYDIRV